MNPPCGADVSLVRPVVVLGAMAPALAQAYQTFGTVPLEKQEPDATGNQSHRDILAASE
jgi:hypothetical protein